MAFCAPVCSSVLLDRSGRIEYTCSSNRGVKVSSWQDVRGRAGSDAMRVQRAYKTELDLTDRQVTACRQHAGAARWAYNWGLRVKQERYRATKKSPTAIALHRELNARKKTDISWLYQVSKCAPQEALWNAGRPRSRASFVAVPST